MALKYLAQSARDDSYMRVELRKLFQSITNLCKDSQDEAINEALTVLYFELFYLFYPVLCKGDMNSYETDFENFVYEWKGQFPSEESIRKFKELTKDMETRTPTEEASVGADTVAPAHKASKQGIEATDKCTLFLEAAKEFGFLKMPKLCELTAEKQRKVVECLLADKGNQTESMAHTAAMLDYLGFYKWIKEKYKTKYPLSEFDQWCGKHIPGVNTAKTWKNYRLSLKEGTKISYKYSAWKYKGSVKKEYEDIVNQ